MTIRAVLDPRITADRTHCWATKVQPQCRPGMEHIIRLFQQRIVLSWYKVHRTTNIFYSHRKVLFRHKEETQEEMYIVSSKLINHQSMPHLSSSHWKRSFRNQAFKVHKVRYRITLLQHLNKTSPLVVQSLQVL